jgi:hypothetical protein
MKQTSNTVVDSPFLETLLHPESLAQMIHPYLSPFIGKTRAGGNVFSSVLLIYEQTAFKKQII